MAESDKSQRCLNEKNKVNRKLNVKYNRKKKQGENNKKWGSSRKVQDHKDTD